MVKERSVEREGKQVGQKIREKVKEEGKNTSIFHLVQSSSLQMLLLLLWSTTDSTT